MPVTSKNDKRNLLVHKSVHTSTLKTEEVIDKIRYSDGK